jgi:hypothetical protein
MRTVYQVPAYLLALSVAVQASLIAFGAFARKQHRQWPRPRTVTPLPADSRGQVHRLSAIGLETSLGRRPTVGFRRAQKLRAFGCVSVMGY